MFVSGYTAAFVYGKEMREVAAKRARRKAGIGVGGSKTIQGKPVRK